MGILIVVMPLGILKASVFFHIYLRAPSNHGLSNVVGKFFSNGWPSPNV